MTLLSYGIDVDYLRNQLGLSDARILEEVKQSIPTHHVAFLERLPAAVSTPNFFFSHAGARPGVALAHQDQNDLLSIRLPLDKDASPPFEKTVVHGHTFTRAPIHSASRIVVETGPYLGGPLTAARILKGAVDFIAAD